MTASREAADLAVLVHEVRSPVAALAAIAEALAGTAHDGAGRRQLEQLAVAACRSIERILIDVTIASVRFERLDVADLVRQAASTASLGGAPVEAQIAGDLPAIEGDPLRLRQALDNLVRNALTHAGSDEVVVVGADSSETAVLLSVADSGIGIPPAEQDRIFEKGVRLSEITPGAGLGLAIVRAIAEAHGGTLTVTSDPGAGATFTISLPRR